MNQVLYKMWDVIMRVDLILDLMNVLVGQVDIKSMIYMETLWFSIIGHDGNYLYIFDEVKAMAFS